ncbi:hypothetical protein DFJ58DRAFT_839740 [Suillus subalutaceus]|uniref:uncharacterized protein n=1 Tax=Suillus subalutaceus TaxID=48586 RepID=UPI001B87C715|nr:uncharacterized protein DFJ58DRAFT_839740 [Suillus subalutaceus]KAG1861615.1 hypothetical protein DFJ58DRAFT_839740 [Suillus subalutaceus]
MPGITLGKEPAKRSSTANNDGVGRHLVLELEYQCLLSTNVSTILQGFKQMLKVAQRRWSYPPIHLHPVEEGNLKDVGPIPLIFKPLDLPDLRLSSIGPEPQISIALIHWCITWLHIHPMPILKKSFKEQLNKFNKTGAGVTPLDENAAVNLHQQVLLEFRGVDHAGDFYALIGPRGGAGPSPRQDTADPRLLPPNHQHLPPNRQLLDPNLQLLDPNLQLLDPNRQLPGPNHQLLGPNHQPLPLDSQPPPLSPHTANNQPITTSTRPIPPSTLTPPPHQPPPPHYAGAEEDDIDDPDGDLYDDPHAADDDHGPFFAPLGNALDTLEGDFNMDNDDDGGMEFNSSQPHDFNLDSPLKVVGHKRQYTASPSPPPIETNSFALWQKPQTPTYHDVTLCKATELCELKEEEGLSESKNEQLRHQDAVPVTQERVPVAPLSLARRTSSSRPPHTNAEQEAKDKEILCLQAVATLQEREAETWHLKIQYETMMCAAGGSVGGPSPSSSSG